MKNKKVIVKIFVVAALLFTWYTTYETVASPIRTDSVAPAKKLYDSLYDSNKNKLSEFNQLSKQVAEMKMKKKKKKQKQ